MSVIPHTFLPRSMFDMDTWYNPQNLGGPSTLDLFDSFDDLDRLMGRNLMWLNKPEFITDCIPAVPKVASKYRINLDVSGYTPKSIKTEIVKDNKNKHKLVVTGKEDMKNSSDDYSVKEFRKTYRLPENTEIDKMASFVTWNGKLAVEVPLKEETQHQLQAKGSNKIKYDMLPRIVEGTNGAKSVAMNLLLPSGIDPTKVSVTCKDRDLIIKAEDKNKSSDSTSSVYYYRRTTLPENTDFNLLKCHIDDKHSLLTISAPLALDCKPIHKTVPIDFTSKSQIGSSMLGTQCMPGTQCMSGTQSK